METIALIILAVLMPIMTIAGFVVGYNINAQRKIFKPKPKKREMTDDEKMLERIDNARV